MPAAAERPTLRPCHAWGPLLNTTSLPRDDDDPFESLWRDGGRPRRMAQLVLWILEENEVTGDGESAFRKVLGEPGCGDWGVLGHPCCGRLCTALRLRDPLPDWLPAPVPWRELGVVEFLDAGSNRNLLRPGKTLDHSGCEIRA